MRFLGARRNVAQKLSALGNLSRELPKKGFGTVDLMSGFVKPDLYAVDLRNLMSPEFDLKSELISGRVEDLTKTDCLSYRDSMTAKRTSCFYN